MIDIMIITVENLSKHNKTSVGLQKKKNHVHFSDSHITVKSSVNNMLNEHWKKVIKPINIAISGSTVKPGLYFSRRLSAAVAYSFVARAGNHGRHRQLSFKCTRALRKYKQSPDRTTKWSIHGIQIQMQIRIRIQISSLSCIYTEK